MTMESQADSLRDLARLSSSYFREISAYRAGRAADLNPFSQHRKIQDIARYTCAKLSTIGNCQSLIEQDSLDNLSRALLHAANYADDFYNEPLAIAILKLFEAVGDHEEVASIQRCMPAMRGRLDTRAQLALYNMRQRLKTEELARTLLRPTTAPLADELLRPAGGPTSEASALLRPADKEAELA